MLMTHYLLRQWQTMYDSSGSELKGYTLFNFQRVMQIISHFHSDHSIRCESSGALCKLDWTWNWKGCIIKVLFNHEDMLRVKRTSAKNLRLFQSHGQNGQAKQRCERRKREWRKTVSEKPSEHQHHVFAGASASPLGIWPPELWSSFQSEKERKKKRTYKSVSNSICRGNYTSKIDGRTCAMCILAPLTVSVIECLKRRAVHHAVTLFLTLQHGVSSLFSARDPFNCKLQSNVHLSTDLPYEHNPTILLFDALFKCMQ